MRKFSAAVLLLCACSGVNQALIIYEAEINACVELADTRDEYEQCKMRAKKRLEKRSNAMD